MNFVDVCGFDARRGFPELQHRIQYVALAIILSDSGERIHRNKIPPS